jgi:transcription termination factor NusB
MAEKKPAKSADKKANRRGAARLAAVQALYQMDIAARGSTTSSPSSKAIGSGARSRGQISAGGGCVLS